MALYRILEQREFEWMFGDSWRDDCRATWTEDGMEYLHGRMVEVEEWYTSDDDIGEYKYFLIDNECNVVARGDHSSYWQISEDMVESVETDLEF